MTQRTRVIYTAEAHVTGGRADGHGRTSDGALDVDLRTPEEMGAAHQMCPYSNATRGNIDVSLTANGRPVEEVSEATTA
jgi:organic hydroperoxide reductase OsmC/OhrA